MEHPLASLIRVTLWPGKHALALCPIGPFQDFTAMTLSQADVERVALLARLDLSPAEVESMTNQLGQVLTYIQLLNELSTEDVVPMAHAIELTNVLAADEVRESLPREEALKNAPKSDSECYRVPAVLGE